MRTELPWVISGPTMAPSSSPRLFGIGSQPSGPEPPTSNRAALGRLAIASFNPKLRDELLNGEIFYTLKEARSSIEEWRRHYNTIRPHSSLGYGPPAPEGVLWPAAQSGPASPAIPALAIKPVMH